MKKLLIVTVLILLVGCARSPYDQGRRLSDEGQYTQASDTFYGLIKEDPKNADAWRELGVNFYRQGDLPKAEEALKQAISIKPDARANLFLGMLYEKQGQYDPAITAYRSALSYQPSGDLKNMIRAHLDLLMSRRVEAEVEQALALENSINPDTIPDNTVAVMEFDATHLPPDLAPLAKGLTEFTAMDLAKVKSLRVVDRMKIEAIRAELQLSASQMTDPGTAPRVGKLAGGRKIVTGSVLGIGEKDIRMDGAVVETVNNELNLTDPSEGELERIFKVQKQFVFTVLDTLGIEITPEERAAIEEMPTESYLAFLAYSRGLDFKDRGMYQEAQQEFEAAAVADAGFSEAGAQAKNVADIAAAADLGGQDFPDFEALAGVYSDIITALGGLDQVQINLLGLNNFFPGGVLGVFGNTPDSPPRVGDASEVNVLVRGNLDVQP